MSQLVKAFRAAKRAATPLIAINTPDPADTVRSIVASFNGSAPPVFEWDIVRGLSAVNKAAEETGLANSQLVPPVDMLISCHGLPESAVVFVHNAHRIIGEQGVSQAIWNLRDPWKRQPRNLVLLSPTLDLPVEIQQDVLVLDEPLPENAALAEIVKDTFRSANMPEPAEENVTKAVDAICGLAAFSAEQACAECITDRSAPFLRSLWDRKRKMIEQQKGLSVWRGGETFDDIGGCENVKGFMKAILAGNQPPRVIVFMDEIEKSFAGNGTDTSGVTSKMTGTMLSWMQDHDAKGMIFIGPPGAAKSAMAKATGNSAGIPTIQFDLSAMEAGIVGESGGNLRGALKIVQAVSQGRTLFLATCNSIGILPPELRRRFTFGTFFFDLPTDEDRKKIWQIYLKKYSAIPGGPFPPDNGWTGAEIKQCVDIAWRLQITLKQAAEFIVPVARSAAQQIQNLREQADGKFISASRSGVYQRKFEEQTATRKLEVM